MPNSRRNFCKNSVYIGFGLSFFPLIIQAKAHETVSKKVLNLTKKAQKVVKVSGQIRYEDLSPVQHATLEIWHNNSESNPSEFEHQGKLITDSEGNYQFETDFPEKHFEDDSYKMRRIFFKIKPKNGEEILTKLYFGANRKAFIDGFHVGNTHEKLRAELPKTKHENDDLSIIQFNIYLNF
jgi:protocatechuate 3,4-dioxygenase beta subunit